MASAVVAVNIMRVLLFVLDVSILTECEGDSNAGVGYGGVASVWHGYVGGGGLYTWSRYCV